MTYREPIYVSLLVPVPRGYAHWKQLHRYYTALRKTRQRCNTCHHRHGASRNHRPQSCRACGCRCMMDWIFVNPPWLNRATARPVLAVRRTKYIAQASTSPRSGK